MSITDLRGRQFAIKITERATQVDFIPSSWHNLTSCGRSTPVVNRPPGLTTNYLSPPIDRCFRAQSENDFPRPTKSQISGSDYMDSSVESLELRRNRSLSLPSIHAKRLSSLSPNVFYGFSPGLNPELSPRVRRVIFSGPGGDTTAIEEREEEVNADHSNEESDTDTGRNDDMCLRIPSLVISKKGKATKRLRSYDITLDKNGSSTVGVEHAQSDPKRSRDVWLRRKKKSHSADELSTNEREQVSMKERIKKRASGLIQQRRNKFSKNSRATLGNTVKSLAHVSADILSVNPQQEDTAVRGDRSGTVVHAPAIHLPVNVRFQRQNEHTIGVDRLSHMPIPYISGDSTMVSGEHLKRTTEGCGSISCPVNKGEEHLEREDYATSQLQSGGKNVTGDGSYVDANILSEDERLEVVKPELRQYSSCAPSRHAECLTQSEMPEKILFEHETPPLISPVRNKDTPPSIELGGNRVTDECHVEVVSRESINKDRPIPNFPAISSEGGTQMKTSGTFSKATTFYTVTNTQAVVSKPCSLPTSLESNSMMTPHVVINRRDSTGSSKDSVELSSRIETHKSADQSLSRFGLHTVSPKEYYKNDHLFNTRLSELDTFPPASVSTEHSSGSEERNIVEASPFRLMAAKAPDSRPAPLLSSTHGECEQEDHEPTSTRVHSSIIPNFVLETDKLNSVGEHQMGSCDSTSECTHPTQSSVNNDVSNSLPYSSACTMETAKPNDLVLTAELHEGDPTSQAVFGLGLKGGEQISKWSEMYGQCDVVTALPKPCLLTKAETRGCDDVECIQSGQPNLSDLDKQLGPHSSPKLVNSEECGNTEFAVTSGKGVQILQNISPYNKLDPKHQVTKSQPILQSEPLADSDFAVASVKNPSLYTDHNATPYFADKVDSTVSDFIVDNDSGLEVESSALSLVTEELNGVSLGSPTDVLPNLPQGSISLTRPDRTQPTSPDWSSKDSGNTEEIMTSCPVSNQHIALVSSAENVADSERKHPLNQTAFEAFNKPVPNATEHEENLCIRPESQGSQALVESTHLVYDEVQPPPTLGHDALVNMQPEVTLSRDTTVKNATWQSASQDVESTELAEGTNSSWSGWIESKIFGQNHDDGPDIQLETKLQAPPGLFAGKLLEMKDHVEKNAEDSSGHTTNLENYQNKVTTADTIIPTTSRELSLKNDCPVGEGVSHDVSESPIEKTIFGTQAAVLRQAGEGPASETGVTSVCTESADQSVTHFTADNRVKDNYPNHEGSSPQVADHQAVTTAGSWSSWIPRGFSFWKNDSEKGNSQAVLSERSNELQLAALEQNLRCNQQQVTEKEQSSELEGMDKTLSLNLGAAVRMIVDDKRATSQLGKEEVADDLPQTSPEHRDTLPYSMNVYTSANPAQTNALSSSSDVQLACVSTTRQREQRSLWSLRTFSSLFNFVTLYIPRHIYWFYVATNEPQERLLDAMAERSLRLAITWSSFQDGLRNPLCVAVIFIGFTTVSPYVRQWPLVAANLIEYTNVYMFVPPFWIDRPILSHLDYLIHSARRSLRWNGRTRVTSFSNRPWSLANPVD
ncbi:hypothetical protein P879_03192 [Paragonimus westermani]|uniref:Uncharacterized protein n=1 Tax=Paragonimus westermani TaxID=34504 RepID=A0A8T0DXS5_9TREM|nr:hypothetical protein P879_03192 [Paragonimus westermani]